MTPKQALTQAKAAVKSGDLAKAQALYAQILQRAPKHSEALKGKRKLRRQMNAPKQPLTRAELARLQDLIAQGDFTQAKQQLVNLTRRAPMLPYLHFQRGMIEALTDRPEAAIECFERALEIDPNYVDARINLAVALGDLGRTGAAIAACETCLKADDKNPFVWLAYGDFLLQEGRGQDAENATQKALDLDPGSAQAWLRRGHVLTSRGQKDAALECFQNAIDRDSGLIAAHVELVRQLGGKTLAGQAAQLQGFLADNSLGPLARAPIHFALADMFQAQGEVAAASQHYARGNLLRKQLNPYDHTQEERQFEALKRVFSNGKMAGITPPARAQPRPVFIVGMNRSGTSLVEQILAGHSQVFGAGELDLIDRFAAPFAGRLDRATAAELEAFRDSYLADLASRGDRPVITDKMPINYRWIGLICHLFPDAQIICLDRAARDVCFSNYTASFGSSGHAYCYDMIDLARNFALHRRVMAFWQEHFAPAIRTLRYEALVENAEAEARALLAWLGLEWQPQVMEFHKLERSVRTLSQGQVHRGIYKTSLQRWRPYADHLVPMFDELARLGITE